MAFPSTWKGQPLPRASCEIDIRWLALNGTRNARDTVVTASVSDDGRLLGIIAADGAYFVLDADSLIDRWEYTHTGRARQVAIAEHETRIGLDPIYAHHAEVLTERMGLAALGVDALAAIDHDGETDDVALADVVEIKPVTSTVDHTLLRRLDALKQRKGLIAAEEKDLNAQIRTIEDTLIEQMAESGQTEGYPFDDRKATVRTDTWGKWIEGVTEAQRWEAFRKAGGPWAELVRLGVNAQTLRSMLVEWEEQHGELPDSLPEPLREVMTTSDKYSITFSKGRATRAKRRIPTATATTS